MQKKNKTKQNKFWQFWEHPLFNIREYAFNAVITLHDKLFSKSFLRSYTSLLCEYVTVHHKLPVKSASISWTKYLIYQKNKRQLKISLTYCHEKSLNTGPLFYKNVPKHGSMFSKFSKFLVLAMRTRACEHETFFGKMGLCFEKNP